jgi:hypothetical protein
MEIYKLPERFGFIGFSGNSGTQIFEGILCFSISEKRFCVRQSVIFMSAFLLRYLSYLRMV